MNRRITWSAGLLGVLLLAMACGETVPNYSREPYLNRRLYMELEGPVEVVQEQNFVFDANQDGSRDTLEMNPIPISSKEIKFDRKGRTLQEEIWREGELAQMTIIAYDTAGRVLEEQEYGEDGKLERSWTCLYGKNGRLAEKQGFTADGKLIEKEVIRYDGENRCLWVSHDFYDRSNAGKREVSRYRCEYEYDGDSEIRTHTRNGELEKVQYFHNHAIQKSERYSVIDGKLAETIEYQDSTGVYCLTFRKGDGSLKRIEKSVLDSGKLVSESFYGPDSIHYAMETRTYNGWGGIASKRYYSNALNFNGVPLDTTEVKPEITEYIYPPNGWNNWTESRSYLPDGTLRSIARRKFIYFED